jgi:hypothetical protein
MQAVLRAYVELWSEPDAGRREELLRICWTEASEIIGPGYYFKGSKAVQDEVARFHRTEPGFRTVLTSGFDGHGSWVRFAFALLNPQGSVVNEGWDIVEFSRDGKIRRVISFWGKLPAVLADWQHGSGVVA